MIPYLSHTWQEEISHLWFMILDRRQSVVGTWFWKQRVIGMNSMCQFLQLEIAVGRKIATIDVAIWIFELIFQTPQSSSCLQKYIQKGGFKSKG